MADTALVNVSPEAYNRVIGTYRTPFVGVLEIGLAVIVIFHALNGLRVTSSTSGPGEWPGSARCSMCRRSCSWRWRSRR